MLKNFFSDEEGTWGNRDMVQQKNDKNSIDGTCEQQGCFNGKQKEHLHLESKKDSWNFYDI